MIANESHVFVPRTRAEKRICQAATAKGWMIHDLWYGSQPGVEEIAGDEWAWRGFMASSDGSLTETIWGYNVADVLDQIRSLPEV